MVIYGTISAGVGVVGGREVWGRRGLKWELSWAVIGIVVGRLAYMVAAHHESGYSSPCPIIRCLDMDYEGEVTRLLLTGLA